jgi:uncharacterized membrane protein
MTLARPAAARGSRLLLASLFLNVFLLGAVLAGVVSFYVFAPPLPFPPPGPHGLLDHMTAVLPPDDAAVLRRSFHENEARVQSAMGRMEDALGRAREVLRTEPFDAEALRTALMGARAARDEMDRAIIDAALSALPELSPAGRAKLADIPPPPGGPPGGGPPPYR